MARANMLKGSQLAALYSPPAKKFGIIISLILFKEQGRPDQAQTHESSTAPNCRVKAFKTGIDSDNPSVNLVVS